MNQDQASQFERATAASPLGNDEARLAPTSGEVPVGAANESIADNPPWAQPPWLGALISLFVWAGSVVSLLLVPILVVGPYIVYVVSTNRQGLLQLEQDKTFLFLSVLGVIPAHIVTFFLAYVVVRRGRSYPFFKSLGFEWPASWSTLVGVVICAVIAGALFGIGALVTWLFPGPKTQLDVLIESSYAARIVTAFLAVATAPLVEEVVYRGMLYPAIARVVGEIVSPAIGVLVSIFVVSSLFAGVHFVQYQDNLVVFGVIVLVSITLTVVRAMTGKLLPCMIIHLIFNGIQAVIILLYPFITRPAEPQPPPAPAELLTLIQYLF